MIIAMTGAAGLFLTGTANAYPIEDPALTENALYGSGELATTKCAEPPIRNNNRTLVKRYITGITKCLDAAWGTHFKAAELPFGKPRLRVVNKAPARYCDEKLDRKQDSQLYYCSQSRTMMMQIGRDWLADVEDLSLLHATGALYAAHLAMLTGIEKAYQDAPYANNSELNEQTRRTNLQDDCLSGVFIRSVWTSLGRKTKDWNELLRVLKRSGDTKGQSRVYGKGTNRAAWTKLGYTTGDPASCNTWTATSAKVA